MPPVVNFKKRICPYRQRSLTCGLSVVQEVDGYGTVMIEVARSLALFANIVPGGYASRRVVVSPAPASGGVQPVPLVIVVGGGVPRQVVQLVLFRSLVSREGRPSDDGIGPANSNQVWPL